MKSELTMPRMLFHIEQWQTGTCDGTEPIGEGCMYLTGQHSDH